ncbi:MAG: inorganic phosphate transporter [Ignavibacteriaceae bacterium]|nr:inorganic phosphate transporter [Ignavibacteriaceae bacterium]
MELYFIIVIVLFLLAASDLIVGVSNDAVNFLNSAVGSKVAPRHIILIIASLGVFVGTVFSSGLMEVARKGIFNPDMFLFQEVMIIFIAVMITDVLLLDLFNTFGLPTSTTVSIVFELLGAAVAVSILKLIESGSDFAGFVDYINSSKALAIISGILLSIAVALAVGALIQFITRLIFTFDFKSRIKRYGAIWGSAALTAITYFILVKGAKGTAFLSPEAVKFILGNTTIILGGSLVFWFVVLQILLLTTKIDILKPIVLIGTFALALAFAANDLVNFIGVPLAGMSSYIYATESTDPLNALMVGLTEPAQSHTLILLAAGAIMVVTLWLSKKARTVTKTEVDLGRQFEGFERFESSVFARSIVRMILSMGSVYQNILPSKIRAYINKRFEGARAVVKDTSAPNFDLLRASVNLMVASILISFATSLKLPLSTTYVTFMVAMGTSLADRAWGRESAVYRVNGVITVIAGWFFTAFTAFTVTAIFATIIFYGGIVAIVCLLAVAAYFLIKTHILHKERSVDEEEMEQIYYQTIQNGFDGTVNSFEAIDDFIRSSVSCVRDALDGLYREDRLSLKQTRKKAKKINKKARVITGNIFKTVQILEDKELKKGKKFGKVINSINEIAINSRSIVQNCYDHIDNNHSRPYQDEYDSLVKMYDFLNVEVEEASQILLNKDFISVDDFKETVAKFRDVADSFDLSQVSRIKNSDSSARNSLLYLRISSDTENISHHILNLVTALKSTFESFAVQPALKEGVPNKEVEKN